MQGITRVFKQRGIYPAQSRCQARFWIFLSFFSPFRRFESVASATHLVGSNTTNTIGANS
jgi:hypothetical protein